MEEYVNPETGLNLLGIVERECQSNDYDDGLEGWFFAEVNHHGELELMFLESDGETKHVETYRLERTS